MNNANFDCIVAGLGSASWRRAAIGLLTLSVVIASQGSAALGEDRTAATLRIVNGTESAVLRCQLVLAHFMTRDLASAAPGRVLDIGLLREAATGTLLHTDAGGRLIAVENVLCGADDDWIATRNDVNLTPLRERGTRQLHIICVVRSGLSCTATEGPD